MELYNPTGPSGTIKPNELSLQIRVKSKPWVRNVSNGTERLNRGLFYFSRKMLSYVILLVHLVQPNLMSKSATVVINGAFWDNLDQNIQIFNH